MKTLIIFTLFVALTAALPQFNSDKQNLEPISRPKRFIFFKKIFVPYPIAAAPAAVVTKAVAAPVVTPIVTKTVVAPAPVQYQVKLRPITYQYSYTVPSYSYSIVKAVPAVQVETQVPAASVQTVSVTKTASVAEAEVEDTASSNDSSKDTSNGYE